MNICPNAVLNLRQWDMEKWVSIIQHELVHLLVFSTSLLKLFDGAGPASKNLIPGVIEKFSRTDWETAKGMITHRIYMIVTPRVREEARAYFNCSDLEGAELEMQGSAGTALQHWEKRVFENEAMAGYTTQVYALSRITLALFEDSGWYQPDYGNAQNMSWGHGLGCNFAKQSCLTWMKFHPKYPDPFCTIYDRTRCSSDREAKVRCNLILAENVIPPEYNYSVPNLYFDRKGHNVNGYGHVDIADYCPYYRVIGELSRGGADSRCTSSENMLYNKFSLEVFSPTARCFELKGGVQVVDYERCTVWEVEVGCFEAACKDNYLHVRTQRSRYQPCYEAGQLIYVNKYIYGVGTVRMVIVCPPCREICGQKFCSQEISQVIGYTSRSMTQSVLQSYLMQLVLLPLLY